MDTALLNEGLAMGMEFGTNWLQPIQKRLAKKHPQLSQAELDEYDRVCREAMNFGHTQLGACWREADAEQRQAVSVFSARHSCTLSLDFRRESFTLVLAGLLLCS